MELTLVVLAAGLGSRYGGLKQVDAVGPGGETILDYSLWDARRAGFGRVVFVIRREFEAIFRENVGRRQEARGETVYVHQETSNLPAGFAAPGTRTKPWGTGHALWSARSVLHGPFAVINADDFYDAESFSRLAAFLWEARTDSSGRPHFAMIGFKLANTLSEHGAVSRGVCQLTADDLLCGLEEQTSLGTEQVGPGRRLSGAELVSMNCWGFTPAVLPLLDSGFKTFLRDHGESEKAEFYLPSAVAGMIARDAVVHVLRTGAEWFGVTYREDKPRVAAAIRGLITAGRYPVELDAAPAPLP